MDNNDFKVSIQIFSGGFAEDEICFGDIKEKLDDLYRHFNIENIIIGWSKNKKIYQDTREYLKKRDTKMLFWYPVFSELGHFREFQPVIDYQGKEISIYKLHKGEKFDFYCPLNRNNLENIKNIYDSEFGDFNFDGVFLDKIRYPSFANGIKALFTCFCPDCREAMKLYGIDSKDLIKEIINISEAELEFGIRNTIRIKDNTDFMYKFENPIWDNFFDFKRLVIYNSIKELYGFFKERKMIVGLDVFAYSLSRFVGQDIKLLTNCSDFIKPMYYRKTWAPAGMPLETDLFNKIFSFDNSCLRTGCDSDRTYPAKLALKELNEINKLNNRSQIYPGVEVNRNGSVSPVFPCYINESLEMIKKSNAKGVVLSWNINNAPQENLESVYEFLKVNG